MCCVIAEIKRGPSGLPPTKGAPDGHEHHTRRFDRTAEAIITLFCLLDDAYALLNPHTRRYESLSYELTAFQVNRRLGRSQGVNKRKH
jgi:hypothetical protein